MRKIALICLLMCLFAVVAPVKQSHAQTATTGPNYWTDSNHGRVFDGYRDGGWLTRDSGGSAPSDQQWIWMDFSDVLAGIETDDRILHATLTWSGVRENHAGTAAGVTYSIFNVTDGNFGRDQIYAAGASATREARDVVNYAQTHTGYGEVSEFTTTFAPKTMDITELIRGWHNGSIAGSGEAMLLWNQQAANDGLLQLLWGNELNASGVGVGPTLEITTMKPEPFTAEVKGPLAIEYDSSGVRPLSPPPSPGVHPRIYFNAEDISQIRSQLLNTEIGQQTMKTIRIYTEMLRSGRDIGWNQQPAEVRIQENGQTRVSNPGIYDRNGIYTEMIQGDLAALSEQHPSAFTIVAGMMSLEAFEIWIDEGQPGVSPAELAQRKANVAAALSTHAEWVLQHPDYPGNLDALGPVRYSQRSLFGSQHTAVTYDLAYNWMTEAQRDVVRKAIGLMMEGFLKASQDGYGEAYYGISTAPESTTSNWATLDLYQFIIAASIEGEIHEGLGLGFTSKELAEWYHAAAGGIYKFYTYGWFASGAPLEGLGKNYMFANHLISISKRGYNFFEHPHVRNYAMNWGPNLIQPFGYGFTAYDEIGGDGDDPVKGGKKLSGYDQIGFKYMYPDHPAVDYAWRNYVGTEYVASDGSIVEVTPISDREYSPRSSVSNGLLELALFGTHNLAHDVSFDNHAALALPELDVVDKWGGTFISRSGHDSDAARLLMHTRQNSGGHTWGDRNTFTLSALGRQFVKYNTGFRGDQLIEGQFHALVDIDGKNMGRPLGGGAPFLAPAKLSAWSVATDHAAFATGDATIAYSTQWAIRDWNQQSFTPITLGYNGFLRTGEGAQQSHWDTPLYDFPHWLKGGETSGYSFAPYNPMRQVFRTAGLIKGLYPYALIMDDIRKDDAPHNYRWYAPISPDLSIVTGSDLPAGLNPNTDVLLVEPAETGNRRLLVRVLRADGTPTMSISNPTDIHTFRDQDGSSLAYTEIIENTANSKTWKRLIIERNNTIAPGYRIMLFPFREEDTIPSTTYTDSKLVVEINGQRDVFDFTPRTTLVDGQTVEVSEFLLSRDGQKLVDYRNVVEPMSVRQPDRAIPQRKAAPNLEATPLADGSVQLTWNTVAAGEQSLVLERRVGSSGEWAVVDGQVSITPNNYRDEAVLTFTDYEYRLRSAGPNGLSEYAFASAASTLLGDVNCDNQVNVLDALFIMQYEVRTRTDAGACPINAAQAMLNLQPGDVNRDEIVNVLDALVIMQCEARITNVLCP